MNSSALCAAATLTTGLVIGLSGPNSALGSDYVAGIRTGFDAINAAGGIKSFAMT